MIVIATDFVIPSLALRDYLAGITCEPQQM